MLLTLVFRSIVVTKLKKKVIKAKGEEQVFVLQTITVKANMNGFCTASNLFF